MNVLWERYCFVKAGRDRRGGGCSTGCHGDAAAVQDAPPQALFPQKVPQINAPPNNRSVCSLLLTHWGWRKIPNRASESTDDKKSKEKVLYLIPSSSQGGALQRMGIKTGGAVRLRTVRKEDDMRLVNLVGGSVRIGRPFINRTVLNMGLLDMCVFVCWRSTDKPLDINLQNSVQIYFGW
ncbi:hypothetical protein AVEN_262331-1 [Araneus ventricosus]|uniref:Uncharacterized protein n=1 Tax=Araneus ventricosus TaxID=182803 RepID=A0A4Y2K6E2_ARAVE|nr:hypothetical protein AVEN_262331-1 [Araneus ventricosus]